MRKLVPETLTATGAEYLRQKIEAYWAARGLFRRARVEQEKMEKNVLFVVRTDLVNGLPQPQPSAAPPPPCPVCGARAA